MKISRLLQELRQDSPIKALEKFNKHAEESADSYKVIHGLLLASPNCDEILSLLDNKEKKLVSSQVAEIFDTIGFILLSIAGELTDYCSIGLHITRQLLSKYVYHIYNLLSPGSSNKKIKTALRCLTGMVMIGAESAGEVLTSLNWERTNLDQILRRRESGATNDPRAWCIYFLVAFLNVSKDSHIPGQFLQKKDLLPLIFPGLMMDSCERILNVLKILQETVLMNPGVSKTVKVGIFNQHNTKHLFDLYRWKRQAIRSNTKENEEEEESIQVHKAVHKFMLTLCSSFKYGIIFQEKPQEGKSNNWFVLKIVSNMKTPWETPEGRELISSVLGSCPDAVEEYFPTLVDLLVPRPTVSFISLMDMLSEILTHQQPWKRMKIKGVKGVLACLVPHLINSQFIKATINSSHESVRFAGLTLVHKILMKTEETITDIEKEQTLSSDVLQRSKKMIISSVFSVVGGIDSYIQSWLIATGKKLPEYEEETVVVSVTAPPVSTSEILLTVAKILTLHTEIRPIKSIQEPLSLLDMLQTIRALPVGEGEERMKNSALKLELQIMCLGFLARGRNIQDVVVNDSLSLDSEDPEKNIYFQLISIYTDAQYEFHQNKSEAIESAANIITDRCQDVIEHALASVGLSTLSEGNIYFWLRHIDIDQTTKLRNFLTHVIIKTVSSISQYTDVIVEAGAKYYSKVSLGREMYSFMKELDQVETNDNEDVSALFVSLPFSRCIPAAIDLLTTKPDPECIQYFSSVVKDYLYSIDNPGFLADLLLQTPGILTQDLQKYLRCWVQDVDLDIETSQCLPTGANLTDILEYLFMARDWSSVEQLLKVENIKDLIERKHLTLVVDQLLLYLGLELNSRKSKTKEISLTKKYIEVLKNIYACLEESSNEKIAEDMIGEVLKHKSTFEGYKPFTSKKSYISTLAQEFIELVLQKRPSIASVTHSYFRKQLKQLKSLVLELDPSVDFWIPVAPFITSENTVIRYEDLEELLIICLKPPSHTPSLRQLVLEVIRLLSKTSSAKRRPTRQSLQAMFSRFLEWGNAENKGDEDKDVLMLAFEKLLCQVVTEEYASQVTSGDLKLLLKCQPSCPDLCCQLVKLYPQHGTVFAKRLKKHKADLNGQAALLSLLLNQEETALIAQSAIDKLIEDIKIWAASIEENEGCSSLFTHALNLNLIDEGSLAEICCQVYTKTVLKKQPPPKTFSSFVLAFHKVAEAQSTDLQLPLSDPYLTLLHICISSIKILYEKDTSHTSLLQFLSQTIRNILPKIDKLTCQDSLTNNKLWSSYVKQVLRHGLSDQILGPDMIHTLGCACSVIYKVPGHQRKAEADMVLPQRTLYQMIMSHSHYLELMFNRDEQFDRLKEEVVALQQILVECDKMIMSENHIPILLGAYGASMSAADQRILILMYTYERNRFMNSYQPVVWGDSAVSHFLSNSSNAQPSSIPKAEHILTLLDKNKIIETCFNFDMKLPLVPQDVQSENRSIYDMRFLIPLMLYLAEEETLSEIEYAECGAIPIGFAALKSSDRATWGAGATILRCMVDKMNNSRHGRLKLPYLWLVGVVSCALDGKQNRLPSLTAYFLIRASQLISQPEHTMYQPVLNFVFLKPAFDLYHIPELFKLYNSDHLRNNWEHRSFLLTMLATGIRENRDYKICLRDFASTLLMGMLQSPTVNLILKIKVLEALESMANLNFAAVDLVKRHDLLSLLSMLPLVMHTSSASRTPNRSEQSMLISSVVKVVAAAWYSISRIIMENNEIACASVEEKSVVIDEEYKSPKRKLIDDEIASEPIKKFKSENTSTTDEKNDNSDLYDEDEKFIPRKKFLPSSFVLSFLSCFSSLTPIVIDLGSLDTTAQFLTLLSNFVEYTKKADELSSKMNLILSTALDPEIIKLQIYERVDWSSLLQLVGDDLSDDDEVRLLGEKAQCLYEKWRNDPLCKVIHNRNVVDDSEGKAEIKKLAFAVTSLLTVLDK